MRQTTGIILLELLTGVVLLAGMVFGLVAWRLMSGPTDLSFFKSAVEQAISEARDGRRVEIEALSLRWQQQNGEFQIVASEMVFLDEEGSRVGATDRAIIDLNAVSLLSGDVRLSEILLDGGQIAIERDAEGVITIAGESLPKVTPVQFHEASSILQYIEQSFLNVIDNALQSRAVGDLRSIRFRNFEINFIDEPLNINWQFDDVNSDVLNRRDVLTINASGAAYGEGAPETAELSAELELDTRTLTGSFELLNQSFAQIPIFDLWTEALDGTVKTDVTILFDVDAYGIDSASVDLRTAPGLLELEGTQIRVGENDLSLIYAFRENTMQLDARNVDAGPFRGNLDLYTDNAASWIEAPLSDEHDLVIRSTGISADFRPYFPSAWQIDDVNIDASVDLRDMTADLPSMRVSTAGITLTGSGTIYANRNQERQNGEIPFGMRLQAVSDGQTNTEEVLKFWPVSLGEGARTWVAENVRSGVVKDARFSLDLSPDELIKGYLSDEALKLEFGYSGAEVSFLSDLPSVQNGRGQARLDGNGFSLDVAEGSFSNWALTAGNVQIPYFMPKGGDIIIRAEGGGSVRDMLRTLSESRLQLEEKYGLQVESISGLGEATFELRRPALSDVSYEDTRFRVDGTVTSGQFDEIYPDISLSEVKARLSADNNQIAIAGDGELDGSPIVFEWSDKFFDETNQKTQLDARGYVKPELLNRMNIPVRAYLTGDVCGELKANGPSITELTRALVELDLQENRLDFSELGWIKPVGEAATAVIDFSALRRGQRTRIDLNSDGLEFSGWLRTDENQDVVGVNLDRLFLENQIDVSGELRRTRQGELRIDVDGRYLNAERLIDGLFSAGDQASPVFGSVNIQSSFDELDLRDGYSMRDVDLTLDYQGPGLLSLNVDGQSEQGDGISIAIKATEGGGRAVDAVIENAGAALNGLIGSNTIEGGRLTVSGELGAQNQPSNILFRIDTVRLKEAPLLTKILALASLRGLADVMSGEGILFSNVEVPLRITQQGYFIDGAKASGPAMGMTAKGHVLDGGENIAIDGVLVPSFGVNSALGGIPILGDLFVSREGEGVFAITYGVRGSMEKAQIAVNPFSGLLPGVLRRIFENPAQEPLPEAEAEDAPQPTE